MSGIGPNAFGGGGMSGGRIPSPILPGMNPVGIGQGGGVGGGQMLMPVTNGGFGQAAGGPFGAQRPYTGPAGLQNFWNNPPGPEQVIRNIGQQGNWQSGGLGPAQTSFGNGLNNPIMNPGPARMGPNLWNNPGSSNFNTGLLPFSSGGMGSGKPNMTPGNIGGGGGSYQNAL